VLAIALKPSDDGKATIVRLFGASGKDRQALLHWAGPHRRIALSDLSEDPLQPVEGAIPVAGWDVVTVRAES
jgi:alpha-mannosidase